MTARCSSPMPVILIADDDMVCRFFCAQALSASDYLVYEAKNGKETIQLALQTRPQVILLDLHLPDMSAFEVIARVRRHWTGVQDEMLLIGMTGDDSTELHASMLIAGFSHILEKPFSVAALQSCLQKSDLPSYGTPQPQHLARRISPSEPKPGVLPQLQATFLTELGQQLSELDCLITALNWSMATQVLHRLCGAAAMSGHLILARRGQLLLRQFQHPQNYHSMAEIYLGFLSQANDLLLRQACENSSASSLANE